MQIGEKIDTPLNVTGEEDEEKEKELYEVTIGAHLDGDDDWIGHAFITVEYPKGRKQTKGFWPKNGFDLSNKDDKGGVIVGMEGAVYDDTDYLYKTSGKNGKKTFMVTESQAKAANDVIQSYLTDPPKYRLVNSQCATFALKVLRAAGKNVYGGIPPRPAVLIKHLN